MYIIPLLIFLLSIETIVGHAVYEIVKFKYLEKQEDYVYKWYGQCSYNMEPYSLFRVDEIAKWNFNDSVEIKKKVMRVCMAYPRARCPMFIPKRFLSLVKNKRVGFLGDSLGQQLFEGVVNQLAPFATTYFNGTHYTPTHEKLTNKIYYREFNATLYYCMNPYLKLKHNKEREPCTEQYYDSTTDYLVIAIGSWFKPKFFCFDEYDWHLGDNYSYNRSFTVSQKLLGDIIEASRRQINATNPKTKVIWRLHPHIGRIDELRMLHNVSTADHTDGEYWSHSSRGSHWVPVYNEIIKSKAVSFGDSMVDWYTLSNQYIDYFIKLGVPMHCDSIHYCSTGVPLGGALLLQDAVFDLVHRRRQFGK